jgi:hypothetical protein
MIEIHFARKHQLFLSGKSSKHEMDFPANYPSSMVFRKTSALRAQKSLRKN